jgi:hypothetical protein
LEHYELHSKKSKIEVIFRTKVLLIMKLKKFLVYSLCLCLIFTASPYRNGRVIQVNAQNIEEGEDQSLSIYIPLTTKNFIDLPEFADHLFGVEHNTKKEYPNYLASIQKIAQSGSAFTRLKGALWANVEPEEGMRNWSAWAKLDQELIQAAQNDVRVILVIRKTPTWAEISPEDPCSRIKESKFAEFGDFLFDLVSRYKNAPYYVKYWQLYSEPDVDPSLAAPNSRYDCWGDIEDPFYGGGYYAQMLKTAYPKIKQADPEAQVIIGGLLLSCDPATGLCSDSHEIAASKFFEGILANQGGNYFDGAAFHSYDFYLDELGGYWNRKWDSSSNSTGPASIAKAQFMKNLMTAYGVSGKYLMNTETAVLCGYANDPPGTPPCESGPEDPFELTKANHLAQSFASAISEGLKVNIWFSLYGWRNSGLVYTNLDPRPAYTAFQFAGERLIDTTYIGPISTLDIGGVTGLKGYKFQRPDGGVIWMLWMLNNKSSKVITLPNPPANAWDVFGNEIVMPNPTTLTVTYQVLYLEWNP